MIFLGIDPGTAAMGYAIVEQSTNSKLKLLKADIIATPSTDDMPHRLALLFDALNLITKEFAPKCMVIEKLFFNTNVKTAMTVGQARGVALLVASKKRMSVHEYTALEAKKILTGYGRADKKEMQSAVRKFMGLETIVKIDDANDAVAMVLCHIHKNNNVV
jgi:crossover junction endodeoxyribonuclease RuvC